LWAKVGAVGNAQRCPRQARRCAAGASSTNPQPASVWRCSSAASWDESLVDPASGGLERRAATELAARGVRVAAVNPRQVRNFARASGELAKTDAIDARILCAFARAIRPAARAPKDADTRELADLLSRRRQLVDMRVQELQRQHTASSRSMTKSLAEHLTWLDKRIHKLDQEMGLRLRQSDVWRAKDDLASKASQAWVPCSAEPCWACARSWAS
jgi:transposase